MARYRLPVLLLLLAAYVIVPPQLLAAEPQTDDATVEPLSVEQIVAIPLGMHADNWIWYSSSLFGELGIEEPTSWDEIIAAADRIDAEGKVGLAIGGEPWQILYVLTDLVIGVGGVELYDALFVQHDAERATGEPVDRTVYFRLGLRTLGDASGSADVLN